MPHSQRLFGTPLGSTDLLGHEPFLDRARLERERGADVRARLALGGYVMARLLDRIHELPEDSSVGLELVYARRFVEELPAGEPEAAHLVGILDAAGSADPQRDATLRMGLTAYAFFLENEGRLEEGLEVLALIERSYGGTPIPAAELAPLAIVAGRMNRLLARWERAELALMAAEEAGAACGDMYSVLRAQLGRASVLRSQGNLPASRAMVEQVIVAARREGQREIEAGAYANLSAVLARMGCDVESLSAAYESFMRFEDPIERMRILGDLGIQLAAVGAAEVARLAFRIVIDSEASALLRMNARLELMDLESAAGNRFAFEQQRQEAKAFADQMPPSMAVDYRYKAGLGLARFGQINRARALWKEGMQLAEAQRLNEWYFRLERMMEGLDGCANCAPPPREAETDESYVSAIDRLATGLREYAALSTASS